MVFLAPILLSTDHEEGLQQRKLRSGKTGENKEGVGSRRPGQNASRSHMVKEAWEQQAGLAMQTSLEISSFHEGMRIGVCLGRAQRGCQKCKQGVCQLFHDFLIIKRAAKESSN